MKLSRERFLFVLLGAIFASLLAVGCKAAKGEVQPGAGSPIPSMTPQTVPPTTLPAVLPQPILDLDEVTDWHNW